MISNVWLVVRVVVVTPDSSEEKSDGASELQEDGKLDWDGTSQQGPSSPSASVASYGIDDECIDASAQLELQGGGGKESPDGGGKESQDGGKESQDGFGAGAGAGADEGRSEMFPVASDVVVMTRLAKYPSVYRAFKQLGWRTTKRDDAQWDLYWADKVPAAKCCPCLLSSHLVLSLATLRLATGTTIS